MDYFRLSESYTSLVLGIIIVIIVSILLLSFFKTRNQPTHQATSSTATSLENDQVASGTPVVTQITTPTAVSTATPTTKPAPEKPVQGGSTYKVKAGDDLWHIAEKVYNDGYKWVIIAKANNLANPGIINVGNSLAIPVVMKSSPAAKVEAPAATIQQSQTISGTTYTIIQGDDLWDIAVRAYGNGYKWVDVAKANNLVNPNVIHAGNILKIPR